MVEPIYQSVAWCIKDQVHETVLTKRRNRAIWRESTMACLRRMPHERVRFHCCKNRVEICVTDPDEK
jgi:hypothetical protein